jgi:hypothetical protein
MDSAAAIAALPPDVNPYDFFVESIGDVIDRRHFPFFLPLLYVNVGLYALLGLVSRSAL